jgi:hypothetical protein
MNKKVLYRRHLNAGRVTETGNLQDLIENKGDFAEFVLQYLSQEPE